MSDESKLQFQILREECVLCPAPSNGLFCYRCQLENGLWSPELYMEISGSNTPWTPRYVEQIQQTLNFFSELKQKRRTAGLEQH